MDRSQLYEIIAGGEDSFMREHTGREPDLEIVGQQFLVRLWAPSP